MCYKYQSCITGFSKDILLVVTVAVATLQYPMNVFGCYHFQHCRASGKLHKIIQHTQLLWHTHNKLLMDSFNLFHVAHVLLRAL